MYYLAAIIHVVQDGCTALHMAAAWGRLEVVDALLRGGACADITNEVCSHLCQQ
jgi:ankyrin repeat protein